MRYLALKELLGKAEDDAEVAEAKEETAKVGWAADILAKQDEEGWWASKEKAYVPKYLSTNWMILILADLGLTRKDPRVAKAAAWWMRRMATEDGGFSMDGSKQGHLCTTGNAARALVKLGYLDHPKTKGCFEWMVKNAAPLGGWSCFGSGRNLDSWEPMSAFAVYPREKWTKGMKDVVEKAAEFFLERELHRQGDHYEPWFRFHYPVHYYYDLLVGLDFMTALGYGSDPRLGHALGVLAKKRRSDGRWNLDAVHPDVEGAMAEWLAKHPKRRPVPFALEAVGRPSKMVTLRALITLNRIGKKS
ncbi:MAG: hypothetical protein JRM80_04340 [Nitrososphaerota archaeon]|nr:hypothetical protein [Nitrososphaerota archaeon]